MYPDITLTSIFVVAAAIGLLCVVFEFRECRKHRKLHDPERVREERLNGKPFCQIEVELDEEDNE